MKKKFFILTGVLFAVLLITVFLILSRSKKTEPIIHLETHTSSGRADSDGDGVANWLEEITDSDSLNAASFPYNKDVVRARESIDEGLLYGGPSDFTKEIIQRFLLDIDDSAFVTDAERDQFVEESADYFLKSVDEKGFPDVALQVDNTVSRKDVLDRFLSVFQRFSSSEKPIDVLIFEVFAKDASVVEESVRMRESCEYALQTLPRKVPRDVYDPYYLVLERIIYLCEALSIALSSPTADNFFYAVRLVGSGGFFVQSGQLVEDASPDDFVLATTQVVQILQE